MQYILKLCNSWTLSRVSLWHYNGYAVEFSLANLILQMVAWGSVWDVNNCLLFLPVVLSIFMRSL